MNRDNKMIWVNKIKTMRRIREKKERREIEEKTEKKCENKMRVRKTSAQTKLNVWKRKNRVMKESTIY